MKAKVLISKRLILKPLSLDHLSETYVSWMNDADVNKYLVSGGGYTFKALESYLKQQEEKDILFWAIHLKETDKHIGNIKIDPIDVLKKNGEYGIMMGDKSEWGKGYAKEASCLVINYCFNKINLSAITLGVVKANLNAVNLYYKIGFICEKEIVDDKTKVVSLRMIKKNDK